jgi:predicted nuclease with TOPRIM domain
MTPTEGDVMDNRVQERLTALRTEFETGQHRLAEIEAQRAQVTETLLRISGAIQVLEELEGERPRTPEQSTNGDTSMMSNG